MINFSSRNQPGFPLVRIHAARKQLAHLHRVRTQPLEIGRGLERPYARFDYKVLGIQHDARQHGLGLQPPKLTAVPKILQQLRHHFGRARSVGLVVKDHGVFYIVDHLPVMVDHHNGLACRIDLQGLHHAEIVRIHDNQQAFGRDHLQRLLRLQKRVFIVLVLRQPLEQRGGKVFILFNGDHGFFSKHTRAAHHADGRSETIQVRKAVAHHDHVVAVFNQFGQRVCNDARLHLGALFKTARNPAIEFKAVLVFNGDLVAAAAQCHISPAPESRNGSQSFPAGGAPPQRR